MRMNDNSWYVVRNTPGVTSFVGHGNRPTPLDDNEVKAILKQMEEEAPKVRVSYQVGQAVKITDGPFTDFEGVVDAIDHERAACACWFRFGRWRRRSSSTSCRSARLVD